MNEHETSSVWSRYRQAKREALAEGEADLADEENLSLEELEAAIAEMAASSGIPETGMPPRSVIHPSRQRQMARWFYRILLLLFTGLVGGLVWWGRQKYGHGG